MYKIFIETAAAGAELPELEGAGGPGMQAPVVFEFGGDSGRSGQVMVNGGGGEIQADVMAEPGQTQVKNADGEWQDTARPFRAGATARIELAPNEPLDLGDLQAMHLHLESDGAAWYPLRVWIEDPGGRVYEGPVDRWLAESAPDGRGVEVDLRLSADLTLREGEAPADRQTERDDLVEDLVPLGPYAGMRFDFNEDVDPDSFDTGHTDGRARSLSIRYWDPDSGELSDEIAATDDDPDWEPEECEVTEPGRYCWEDARTLIVGPPQGGWELGRHVRFELDRSLCDLAGNPIDGDQVVVAAVAAEIILTIEAPDGPYLPWESGDEAAGDPSDFYVQILGTLEQEGGRKHVESLVVTATNQRRDDPEPVTAEYRIPVGDADHDQLFDEEADELIFADATDETGRGTRWEPDGVGGSFEINLPLPGAVAEQRYKWTIGAKATSQGIKSQAPPVTVYHEIFKPKVTAVSQVLGDDSREVPLANGRPSPKLKFNRRQRGTNVFRVDVRGDFEEGTFAVHSPDPETRILPPVRISPSDAAEQGEERARVTLELVIGDGDVSDHSLRLYAETKAGTPVDLDLSYTVDTTPLELVAVASVPALLGQPEETE